MREILFGGWEHPLAPRLPPQETKGDPNHPATEAAKSGPPNGWVARCLPRNANPALRGHHHTPPRFTEQQVAGVETRRRTCLRLMLPMIDLPMTDDPYDGFGGDIQSFIDIRLAIEEPISLGSTGDRQAGSDIVAE